MCVLHNLKHSLAFLFIFQSNQPKGYILLYEIISE